MKIFTVPAGSGLLLKGHELATARCAVAVVGSGAAGLAAALRLAEAGVEDVVLVTEDMQAGTSRNTGSDKQTYYKLTLAGDAADSVGQMAETLFSGGSMDGDLARIEAALSAECFHWLCRKGVPFPLNEYGEAVGYKTDHDPLSRASSAGPLTSRLMVESLEDALAGTDVRVFDRQQVVSLLKNEKGDALAGLLCLATGSSAVAYTLLLCPYVVFAVGGPALAYADSVYPGSQAGGSGLALAAGVKAVNLTEWQYGLASVQPRWNVSGSYQQVLPRYISTDAAGGDEQEFLHKWLPDRTTLLDMVFKKGYQWPFDVRKLQGSSLVDLLVYNETVLENRRVFLDFRQNTAGEAFDLAVAGPEASAYLGQAGITGGLPWQRLRQLNEPAYQFYLGHGIDLARQALEIRLCAQHHNGGLAVDTDWQSSLPGLFPVGEACGSHGVYRPGGSALNSGQVGASRAAARISQLIRQHGARQVEPESLLSQLENILVEPVRLPPAAAKKDRGRLAADWQEAQARLTARAGPLRRLDKLPGLLLKIEEDLAASDSYLMGEDAFQLALAWRYREMLLVQRCLVTAMLDYAAHGGASRGSALYLAEDGQLPWPGLPDFFRSRLAGPDLAGKIQELRLAGGPDPLGTLAVAWRPARPVPRPDEAFETVWQRWREQQI